MKGEEDANERRRERERKYVGEIGSEISKARLL